MTRVLLINSNRFRHPWPVIPFGLLQVAASLDSYGNNLRFLDLCFSHNCEKEIKDAISSFLPEVIGIGIRNIDDTGGYKVHFLLDDLKNDIILPCKKYFSGPIVIGGPAVGISGTEMLDFFDLEYAIRGDGEVALPQFVDCFMNNLPLDNIPGLIIRHNKTIIKQNEPCRSSTLNEEGIPVLSRFIDIQPYRRLDSPLHIQTKRGCAFKCSYCTYNSIEGNAYRLKDPSRVAEEIEKLVIETNFRNIEFTDSVFNVPLSHAKNVLREIIGKNLNLRLHAMGLSPAAIDEELLGLMKQAGFVEAGIGAESMCNEILKDLAKEFDSSDIMRVAGLLRRKRIPATWFILLGSPQETEETVRTTLTHIARTASPKDLIFISTGIRIYAGAPLAMEFRRIYNSDNNDNFLRPVKIEPAGISLEKINSIVREFSFDHPNFYTYNEDDIVPGWLLHMGTLLLKIIGPDQPVWKFLIGLRAMEKFTGVSFLKKHLNKFKRNRKLHGLGFSTVKLN